MFFSLLVSIGTGLPPLPETIEPSLDDCIVLGLSRTLPSKKEIIKIYSIILLNWTVLNNTKIIKLPEPSVQPRAHPR